MKEKLTQNESVITVSTFIISLVVFFSLRYVIGLFHESGHALAGWIVGTKPLFINVTANFTIKYEEPLNGVHPILLFIRSMSGGFFAAGILFSLYWHVRARSSRRLLFSFIILTFQIVLLAGLISQILNGLVEALAFPWYVNNMGSGGDVLRGIGYGLSLISVLSKFLRQNLRHEVSTG